MNPVPVSATPERWPVYAEAAERIVATWPEWKRKTRATSWPREESSDGPERA